MNTTKLVVLGLVFLSAILIHILIIQKEGFQIITPINATNVKKLFIDSMQELIAHYNTLKNAPENIQSDKRFKKQRILLTNFINNVNSKYSEYEYAIDNYNQYDSANALTLEELGLFKRFLFYKVNDTYTSLIQSASSNDLNTLTSRLSNITTTVISSDIMKIPGATSMLSWINSANAKIQENFTKLKRGYGGLSDTNKPVLKSQLYITFLLDAYDNFDSSKVDNTTIPLLQIDNIPVSFTTIPITSSSTSTSGGATTSNILTTSYGGVGSNIGSGAGSNMGMGWSGDRLKSLFYSLVSYGKIEDTPTKKQKEEYNYATLDDIRNIVDDELEAKLKEIKKGPKDDVNDKLSDRNTKPASSEDKTATCSDSLAQGNWFRSAADEGCPYAAGQAPVPYPIDMSEYIRKDSIPCWGCTLK
jgi:hypothetical protein